MAMSECTDFFFYPVFSASKDMQSLLHLYSTVLCDGLASHPCMYSHFTLNFPGIGSGYTTTLKRMKYLWKMNE